MRCKKWVLDFVVAYQTFVTCLLFTEHVNFVVGKCTGDLMLWLSAGGTKSELTIS